MNDTQFQTIVGMFTQVIAAINQQSATFSKQLNDLENRFDLKIEDIKKEMRDGFAEVRQEMAAEFTQVRQEMSDGFAEVRQELNNGLANQSTTSREIPDLLSDNYNYLDTDITAIKKNHNKRLTRLKKRAA